MASAYSTAPASAARHLVALKMFYRFLRLEERAEPGAVELLNSPALWERIPQVLSPESVEKLLAAPLPSDRFCLRDRALLETLYATGSRASEVVGLRLDDLHLDSGFCKCQGKGNKQRVVPLGRPAVNALRAYLDGPHAAERDLQLAATLEPDLMQLERVFTQSGHLLANHATLGDLAATLASRTREAPLAPLLPAVHLSPLWGLPDAHAGLLRTLEGHTHWATGVTYSPDGRRLASCGADGCPTGSTASAAAPASPRTTPTPG